MSASDLITSQQDFAGTQAANAIAVANQVLSYITDLLNTTDQLTAPSMQPQAAPAMTAVAGDISLSTTYSDTVPIGNLPTPSFQIPALPAVDISALSLSSGPDSIPQGTVPIISQLPQINIPPATVPDGVIPSGGTYQALFTGGFLGGTSDGKGTGTDAGAGTGTGSGSGSGSGSGDGSGSGSGDGSGKDPTQAGGTGTVVQITQPTVTMDFTPPATPSGIVQIPKFKGNAGSAGAGALEASQAYGRLSVDLRRAIDDAVQSLMHSCVPQWSRLSDLIDTSVQNILEGGATFLGPALEQALFNKRNQRIDQESRANQRQVTRNARKRGFEVPQFALIPALNATQQADSDRRAQAATETLVEFAKINLEAIQICTTASTQIKQLVTTAVTAYAGLILQAQAAASDWGKGIGQICVGAGGVDADVYRSDVSLYGEGVAYINANAAQLNAIVAAYSAQVGMIAEEVKWAIAGLQAEVETNKTLVDAQYKGDDISVRYQGNFVQQQGVLANLAAASEGHAVQAQGNAVAAQRNAVDAQGIAVDGARVAVQAQGNAVQAQGNTVSTMHAIASVMGSAYSAGAAMQGHAVAAQGNTIQNRMNEIRKAEIEEQLKIANKRVVVDSTQVSASITNALIESATRTNIAKAEINAHAYETIAAVLGEVSKAMAQIGAGAMTSISGIASDQSITNN